MSTRENRKADLEINSRPLKPRFEKEKKQTSTSRGHYKPISGVSI